MPTSCCIKGCTNRHTKGCNLGFFRLPTETPRRNTWLTIIGDKVTNPSDSSRICGTHFTSGRPSQDPDNVDFVPTVFASSTGDPSATLQPRHHLQCRVHGTGRNLKQSKTETNIEEHVNNSSSSYRHYVHRRELENQDRQVLNQQGPRHERLQSYDESFLHQQQQSNVRLKRTSSYDGHLDDPFLRNAPVTKLTKLNSTDDFESNGHYNGNIPRLEELSQNGNPSRESRVVPHAPIPDTVNAKTSRLFFPRALATGSDTLIKNNRQFDPKADTSLSSSSYSNQMLFVNSSNSHERNNGINRQNRRGATEIYIKEEELDGNQMLEEENVTLKQRISSLDRIVMELKTQLREQQHYINRLQTFAERRVSPTSFANRRSPRNDDDLSCNPQSSSSSIESYKSAD